MNIIFHKNFKKSLEKQPQKIKTKFKEAFIVFEEDQFHYSLNNHALIGKFKGWRSISITSDIRVHYEEIESGIILMDIGNHSELY